MNEVAVAVMEALVLFNRIFKPRGEDEISELIPIWVAVISDLDGATPETIKLAAIDVLKTCSDFWPKPAQLREALIPHAIEWRRTRFELAASKFAALPERSEIALTPERKQEIIAAMPDGARQFLAEIFEGRNNKQTIHRNQILRVGDYRRQHSSSRATVVSDGTTD